VEIQRVWDGNYQVYGPRKVWRQLRREGHRLARCTVRRLMRAMGLAGAVRGRTWTTTTQPSATAGPADLVERAFVATRPNQLWVSDFTYLATWSGFAYVAFVVDVFAPRIVGWRVSSSLRTAFVLDALEQALAARGDDDALAESVIGLFKTEVIRRLGPWRSLEAVEFATLAWVDWFNTRRLLEPIGYLPPAEYEARYSQQAAVA
jgi:putative transposase